MAITLKSIAAKVKKLIRGYLSSDKSLSEMEAIKRYESGGRIAWSKGYNEFKFRFIDEQINSKDTLASFADHQLSPGFGVGLDERVVEYPWVVSNLSNNQKIMLDAGSTFNYEYLLRHSLISQKYLFIHTYNPEKQSFNNRRISYVYGDLRELPYKSEFFDEVVSQSTIEHIDMDNSIYGYDIEHTVNKKSYEYLKAVVELIRVLKKNGSLLLTFPFGKYEHHGFFQQFDEEMLNRILTLLNDKGEVKIDFFKYEKGGWRFAGLSELSEVVSFNPHSGKGKLDDGAAHCRSVACIKFIKSAV